MSQSELDRTIEGIDRHLAYLHKQRWAQEHATLRETARTATGDDRERAEQAVLDHYKTRDHPETSRDALVQQARTNHAARSQA